MRKYKLSIIAAVSLDGIIGVGNNIPWYIPEDLNHYKSVTTGNHIIISSKTYDLLPEVAKKNREYYVLSRNLNSDKYYPNQFTSVNELLEYFDSNEDFNGKTIYIAGGSQIYEQLIDHCNEAIISWVDILIKEGDKFFPIDKLFHDFQIIDDCSWIKSSQGLNYKHTTYERTI
jgi:dihydrofolate reductase